MRGSWRLNRIATYWPTLVWPSAFLSRSLGLLNRGPGAQPLWVLVFSTASPTGLVSKLLNRRLEVSPCWVLAFSTTSCLQLVWSPNWLNFLCTQLYNSSRPPSSCGSHNFALIQPVHGQGYNIPIIPQPDAPVIYIGAFPILTAQPGCRSIYNKMYARSVIKISQFLWHSFSGVPQTSENNLDPNSLGRIEECYLEAWLPETRHWPSLACQPTRKIKEVT